MPRKPANLQLAGGKGPRQRAWDLIRARNGERFELLDVCPGDINTDTVRTYLKSLEAAGIIAPDIERVGTLPHYHIKGYTLVNDLGLEAPRVRRDGTPVTMGLAQEQMWRALRMIKSEINARELAAHAGTSAVRVAENTANKYLQALNIADYLIVTQPARTVRKDGGKAQARYRLKPGSDTGPRAPMICRAHVLYDPNTDERHPLVRVTEEDAIYGK